MVIAAVGEQRVGPPPGSSASALDRGDGIDQGHGLGDVVAVAAGEDDGQGGAVAVGDQVVFRARTAPVDR
jgi:hypothetical protein